MCSLALVGVGGLAPDYELLFVVQVQEGGYRFTCDMDNLRLLHVGGLERRVVIDLLNHFRDAEKPSSFGRHRLESRVDLILGHIQVLRHSLERTLTGVVIALNQLVRPTLVKVRPLCSQGMLKCLPGDGHSLSRAPGTVQYHVCACVAYRLRTDAVHSLELHLVFYSDLE